MLLIQIWSLRFSGDSREIIAGAQYGEIYVYDIEAQRRVLNVPGHSEDVNSVTFADSSSSNLFVSGGDDSMLKVWDRRSLERKKAAGCLPGHTEGITYISPKGDGRYCISNSKDQSLRLWDLRCLRSEEDIEHWSPLDYGLPNWDYRYMPYRRPRFYSHPEDSSVMTYRTCPADDRRTLGAPYTDPLLFQPSRNDGPAIHLLGQRRRPHSCTSCVLTQIWSLDGQVAQIIDRNYTHSLESDNGLASDPSAPEWSLPPAQRMQRTHYMPGLGGMRSALHRDKCIVRDVSWHSEEPTLMSTSWDGGHGQTGSIAQHEWKGPEKCLP